MKSIFITIIFLFSFYFSIVITIIIVVIFVVIFFCYLLENISLNIVPFVPLVQFTLIIPDFPVKKQWFYAVVECHSCHNVTPCHYYYDSVLIFFFHFRKNKNTSKI